jgi:hypothetical protein
MRMGKKRRKRSRNSNPYGKMTEEAISGLIAVDIINAMK